MPHLAASSLRNWAKERIDSSFSSRNPPRLFLTESIFVQESPQHIRKSRTARVVLAVDLFTAFGQVMFQFPQVRPVRLIWLAIFFVSCITS